MKPYIRSDLEAFETVRDECAVLRKKHSRRKRSPRIFVRFYEEVAEDIADFERRGCVEYEERIAELKRVLHELRDDYKSSLRPGERQMDWGGFYCGGSPEVQGGRADGNKS